MARESKLETEVKKSSLVKIKRALTNYFRGLLGYQPLNDNVSAENHVVDSFIYGIDDVLKNNVSPNNILVGSLIYDPKRKGFY